MGIMIPAVLGIAFGTFAWGDQGGKVFAFLGLGIYIALAVPKMRKSAKLKAERLRYFPD